MGSLILFLRTPFLLFPISSSRMPIPLSHEDSKKRVEPLKSEEVASILAPAVASKCLRDTLCAWETQREAKGTHYVLERHKEKLTVSICGFLRGVSETEV